MADISDEERGRRIDAAMAEADRLRESGAPTQVYWMSFTGDNGFIGVAIVDDAVNPADAIRLSHQRGCNPRDCEVAFMVMPPIAFEEDAALKNAPRNVLMPRAELLARGLIVEDPT